MSNPVTQTTKLSLPQKARAVVRLTRWREHVPYTIPLVLAGALMSVHVNEFELDWRLLPVLFANILAMSFAFMINDIEDAPDDAHDPRKKENNVISSGILSYAEGITVVIATFVIALGLYVIGGWKTFGTGGLTLVLCYLYSASPFRLKARPIVDILSHATALSGLIMLSGYLTYYAYPEAAWLMILSVTFGSAYGQFYNQYDDFAVDTHVGLNNTAGLVGKRATQFLMYGSVTGAVLSFAGAIWLEVFPLWLAPIALVIIFSLLLFRWQGDMRGKEADPVGLVQVPVLLGANLAALIWLVGAVGLLVVR